MSLSVRKSVLSLFCLGWLCVLCSITFFSGLACSIEEEGAIASSKGALLGSSARDVRLFVDKLRPEALLEAQLWEGGTQLASIFLSAGRSTSVSSQSLGAKSLSFSFDSPLRIGSFYEIVVSSKTDLSRAQSVCSFDPPSSDALKDIFQSQRRVSMPWQARTSGVIRGSPRADLVLSLFCFPLLVSYSVQVDGLGRNASMKVGIRGSSYSSNSLTLVGGDNNKPVSLITLPHAGGENLKVYIQEYPKDYRCSVSYPVFPDDVHERLISISCRLASPPSLVTSPPDPFPKKDPTRDSYVGSPADLHISVDGGLSTARDLYIEFEGRNSRTGYSGRERIYLVPPSTSHKSPFQVYSLSTFWSSKSLFYSRISQENNLRFSDYTLSIPAGPSGASLLYCSFHKFTNSSLDILYDYQSKQKSFGAPVMQKEFDVSRVDYGNQVSIFCIPTISDAYVSVSPPGIEEITIMDRVHNISVTIPKNNEDKGSKHSLYGHLPISYPIYPVVSKQPKDHLCTVTSEESLLRSDGFIEIDCQSPSNRITLIGSIRRFFGENHTPIEISTQSDIRAWGNHVYHAPEERAIPDIIPRSGVPLVRSITPYGVYNYNIVLFSNFPVFNEGEISLKLESESSVYEDCRINNEADPFFIYDSQSIVFFDIECIPKKIFDVSVRVKFDGPMQGDFMLTFFDLLDDRKQGSTLTKEVGIFSKVSVYNLKDISYGSLVAFNILESVDNVKCHIEKGNFVWAFRDVEMEVICRPSSTNNRKDVIDPSVKIDISRVSLLEDPFTDSSPERMLFDIEIPGSGTADVYYLILARKSGDSLADPVYSWGNFLGLKRRGKAFTLSIPVNKESSDRRFFLDGTFSYSLKVVADLDGILVSHAVELKNLLSGGVKERISSTPGIGNTMQRINISAEVFLPLMTGEQSEASANIRVTLSSVGRLAYTLYYSPSGARDMIPRLPVKVGVFSEPSDKFVWNFDKSGQGALDPSRSYILKLVAEGGEDGEKKRGYHETEIAFVSSSNL